MNEQNRFQCPCCDYSFRGFLALAFHIDGYHGGRHHTTYGCFCGEKFQTLESFEAHLLIHEELRDHYTMTLLGRL